MLVVATAGHVDHGKSSLVLALTGTDPDRWDEEKRRGLTIDLGFAFTALPSGAVVGFVDVPGHVRFLKNMLAGAGAVPAAVLVVAAPEGWMPQTEEHLQILELLGVTHGFTVVTMADLVDHETVETAQLEAASRLEGTFLGAAPIVACDSLSGRGLDGVVAELEALATRAPAAADLGRPRMWVDRVFSARGAGTIVTGTLAGGAITVGDVLAVHPGAAPARVRSIQSGHETLDHAEPGARVALNLADVERETVQRGHAVVVAAGAWAITDVVDARLHLVGGASMARRARLKGYVGSGEHDVVVRDLGDGLVRVTLPHALPLAPGDRVLLRDPGPDTTLGAAEVLDVEPARRARDARVRLARPTGERLLDARPLTTAGDLARLGGLTPDQAEALADDLVASSSARRIGDWIVSATEADRLGRHVEQAVDRHHRDRPLEAGVDLTLVARRAGVPIEVIAQVASAVPHIVIEGHQARRDSHHAAPAEDPDGQRLLTALRARPFDPPTPAEAGVGTEVARALVRVGEVLEVGGVFWATDAYTRAVGRIADALNAKGALSVGDVRDCLGTSRKHVLPLLARLDSEGITRRRGDLRVAGPRLAAAAGRDTSPGGPGSPGARSR